MTFNFKPVLISSYYGRNICIATIQSVGNVGCHMENKYRTSDQYVVKL